jgi:integrase
MRVSPKVVQELLAHSTITLTLDTYSHVMPDLKRDAVDKLSGLFDSRPAEKQQYFNSAT